MKNAIKTIHAPEAKGPFSQGIVTEDLIFTAGQIALTTEGKLLEGSIQDQTHQVLKNLKAILAEAGATFKHVVKVTIYVTDISNYAEINEVYGTYMQAPFPARELVCVKALPLGADIEISMVAQNPKAN
jgi:2-iminobutanoate/2-iminopropanoate deaminase